DDVDGGEPHYLGTISLHWEVQIGSAPIVEALNFDGPALRGIDRLSHARLVEHALEPRIEHWIDARHYGLELARLRHADAELVRERLAAQAIHAAEHALFALFPHRAAVVRECCDAECGAREPKIRIFLLIVGLHRWIAGERRGDAELLGGVVDNTERISRGWLYQAPIRLWKSHDMLRTAWLIATGFAFERLLPRAITIIAANNQVRLFHVGERLVQLA